MQEVRIHSVCAAAIANATRPQKSDTKIRLESLDGFSSVAHSRKMSAVARHNHMPGPCT